MEETLRFKELFDKLNSEPDEPGGQTEKDLEELFNVPHIMDETYDRLKESALHYAVKNLTHMEVQKRVIKKLIKQFPDMVTSEPEDTKFNGQTPFHIAVCEGRKYLVELFLNNIDNETKNKLFAMRATGEIFKNTITMAQIPFSIAALTCNKGILELLIKHGARIDGTSSNGDNVCHSLIRFANLNKDKVVEVRKMFEYLSDPSDKGPKADTNVMKGIWLMHNEDGLTPLRLAAALGQHELFKFIINLDKVYCFFNNNEGMFDIKMYDITEIDEISWLTKEEGGEMEVEKESMSCTKYCIKSRKDFPDVRWHYKSVLMILLELNPNIAFHFLLIQPVQRIIQEKWSHYKMMIRVIWLLFFICTCILLWYCVERAQQEINSQSEVNNPSQSGFNITAPPKFKIILRNNPVMIIIQIAISIMLLSLEVIRAVCGRLPYSIKSFINPYSNSCFRLFHILISLLLIADLFAASLSSLYENYCLLVAMTLVCFTHIFFLRAVKRFSFVTVLMTKVILGDMLHFFVIIAIEWIAFATAMYMAIQGSNVIFETNFSDYGRVLFSMITLMVGLGDTVNFYDTRHYSLTIAIFVAFVVMTTLLMINSLIAMVSRTCSELFDNVGEVKAVDRHWHLQRLSMILFMESTLPASLFCHVGNRCDLKFTRDGEEKTLPRRIFSLKIKSDCKENASYVESASSVGTALDTILKKLTKSKERRRKRKYFADDVKTSLSRQETMSDQLERNSRVSQDIISPIDTTFKPVETQKGASKFRRINIFLRNKHGRVLEGPIVHPC